MVTTSVGGALPMSSAGILGKGGRSLPLTCPPMAPSQRFQVRAPLGSISIFSATNPRRFWILSRKSRQHLLTPAPFKQPLTRPSQPRRSTTPHSSSGNIASANGLPVSEGIPLCSYSPSGPSKAVLYHRVPAGPVRAGFVIPSCACSIPSLELKHHV